MVFIQYMRFSSVKYVFVMIWNGFHSKEQSAYVNYVLE